MLNNASKIIGVDLFNSYFLQEAILIVTRDNENIDGESFLAVWDYLSQYLALRNYEWGEGESIGLAANHAGWILEKDYNIPKWLFKDLYSSNLYLSHGVTDKSKLNKIKKYRIDRVKIAEIHHKMRVNKLVKYILFFLRYLKNIFIFANIHRDLKHKIRSKAS